MPFTEIRAKECSPNAIQYLELLAPSPDHFKGDFVIHRFDASRTGFTLTNAGLSLTARLAKFDGSTYALLLNCAVDSPDERILQPVILALSPRRSGNRRYRVGTPRYGHRRMIHSFEREGQDIVIAREEVYPYNLRPHGTIVTFDLPASVSMVQRTICDISDGDEPSLTDPESLRRNGASTQLLPFPYIWVSVNSVAFATFQLKRKAESLDDRFVVTVFNGEFIRFPEIAIWNSRSAEALWDIMNTYLQDGASGAKNIRLSSSNCVLKVNLQPRPMRARFTEALGKFSLRECTAMVRLIEDTS